MKQPPARFLLVFAILWTAMVGLFDAMIFADLWRQTLTLRYATTQGRILVSEITEHSGSESTTYGAHVVYEFTVDGRRYESDRVRFGQMSESSGNWARQVVRDNPPGALRTVHHDRDDPSVAVLQRGPDGGNAFMVLFITPFNAAAVMIVWFARAARRASPPRGGARVVAESSRLLVFLNPLPRAATHLIIWGGISFAGIFVIAFTHGFAPPISSVAGVWAVAALASVYAFFRKKPPTPDLVIDAAAGQLRLTRQASNNLKSFGEWRAWRAAGKPELIVAFDRICSITARERQNGDSHFHVVCVSVAASPGAPAHDHDLGSWMLADRAESFAAWLRETLLIPATEPAG